MCIFHWWALLYPDTLMPKLIVEVMEYDGIAKYSDKSIKECNSASYNSAVTLCMKCYSMPDIMALY